MAMHSLKWPTIFSWFSLGTSVISFILLQIIGLGDFGAAFFLGIIGGIVVSALSLSVGLVCIRPPFVDTWRRKAIVSLVVTLLPGGAVLLFMIYALFHLPVH